MSSFKTKLNAFVNLKINNLVECTTGLAPDDGVGNYGRAVDYVRKSIDAPHQYVTPTPKKVQLTVIYFSFYLHDAPHDLVCSR